MNSRPLNTSHTIRFRRWSRAGYAVFCSLTCCVSIGALSVSVSDKTLLKTEITKNEEDFINLSSRSDHADILELEAIELQIQNITKINSTPHTAATCGKKLYTFINQNGWNELAHFNRF